MSMAPGGFGEVTSVSAQTYTPYSYFRTLTQQERDTFQLMLKSMLMGSAGAKSVIIHASSQEPHASDFEPFYRPADPLLRFSYLILRYVKVTTIPKIEIEFCVEAIV